MFGFFKKKVDVLNHWIAFADGFQTSPGEFYTAVKKELAERKVPSMEMSEIKFPEGGLLSEDRIYLRMLRERLVFDICAAPFGTGFFFSCRTSEIPLVLKLWQLVALVLILLFVLYGLIQLTSFWWGTFITFALLATLVYLMRNAVAMGLQDLDKTLIQSPLIGSVYEVFFRKDTYHRIDSRLCYLEVVPTVVKKIAEDATAEKGIKLVRQYAVSPILGELYQPVLQMVYAAPDQASHLPSP